MKLQELLVEYRQSLPVNGAPSFEALLRREKRRKAWRLSIGAALAAAACMAGVMFWPRPVPVPHEAPVAIAFQPLEAAQPAPPTPVRRTRPKRRPGMEAVAGFVAIAETSMLPQPAAFQVLRVSVSGQRLAALGVLRPDQLVRTEMTADVLLGDDGMARAIRVVANE